MEKINPPPVYPKTDPEYKKRVMEALYKKVRETNWSYDENGYQGKPRGRKAKVITRAETKPRTKSEEQALANKFFNFNK
jgi:hypothetical protein